MAKDETASKKSQQSIDQFHITPQELLAGARNDFWLEMLYDFHIQMDFNNKTSLINRTLFNPQENGHPVFKPGGHFL